MARDPHNMFLNENARKHIPDYANICDVYEVALLFEPFLLPLMWPIFVEGLESDRLRRLRINGRVHLWRTLYQSLHDSHAAEYSRAPIAQRVQESHAWIRKHPEVSQEFFDKVLEEEILNSYVEWTQIHLKAIWQMVGIADQHDATLFMHQQNAWYASDRIALPSQEDARQHSLAMTAIRPQIVEESSSGVRDLTVEEVLRLRKKPEVVGLRTATKAVINSVTQGQESVAVAASRELAKARRHLAKQGLLGRLETICMYAALPIGIAELILALPPIAGLSIGATAVFSNMSKRRIGHKHAWLSTMFERG